MLRRFTLLYAGALALGLGALYAFGLHNQLIFDDARLTDGTIFGQYGSLWQFKPRLLSYGSFVWLQSMFGEGWWKQRVFNIGLHIATALALYALVLDLLKLTRWEADSDGLALTASLPWAAALAVAMWAFNPVAVYAVAYLIQRSILMATLLVVLACWAYVRALVRHQRGWHVLAAACYLLAVGAKEHAVSAALLAVPLFVYVRRPPWGQVLRVSLVAGVLVAGVGALLLSRYGAMVGTVFDETSRAYALQLEQQRPGISQQVYILSVINQASLYFRYGLIWLVPWVGAMSIDIRPAFPLTLWSAQLLGAFAWVLVLAGAAWLVVRRGGALGLIGLGLTLPGLLYVTEFSTVWLQDPFVLYRSYLWSFPLAALLALPWVGQTSKTLYGVGVLVVALLAGFSLERIASLQTPTTAWLDASNKLDRQAPANAVGRWRALLNLGAESLDRGNYEEALRLFSQAEALGEPLGSARFSIGVSLQQLKKYTQALDNFAQAEAKGFTEPALYYQRGEAQYALGRFGQAYDSFSHALQLPQAEAVAQFTRQRQAEAAMAGENFAAAIASYRLLAQQSPDQQRYQIGLAMAYTKTGEYAAALSVLDAAIVRRATGAAYYARALTHYFQGETDASAKDLEPALSAEPGNPNYLQLRQQLDASTAQRRAKP